MGPKDNAILAKNFGFSVFSVAPGNNVIDIQYLFCIFGLRSDRCVSSEALIIFGISICFLEPRTTHADL